MARQAAADKKKSDDLDDEQRRQKEVQRRIKAAGGLPEGDIPQATALKRGADDEKVRYVSRYVVSFRHYPKI